MKLPLDCNIGYIEDFLTSQEAHELYNLLIDQYHLDQARLIIEAGGQLIKTDSLKILFLTDELINQNAYPEHVHGKSYPWSGKMAELRHRVESYLDKSFEVAMCLYYPNGNFFAKYHYDQQTSGYKTILPSLSLGEVREFSFKHQTKEECYSLDLAHGSLLVMADYCQSRYVHSLIQNPKYKNGRINITFREPSFQ